MTGVTAANGNAIDLRLGRWQDVLADVGEVDTLISDPPYSERTHDGQQHGRRSGTKRGYREPTNGASISTRGLGYQAMTDADVTAFCDTWSPRVRGWIAVFTDSELYPAWRDALRMRDRYVFAPLACVQSGMNVRLAGDGPSNWTTWLVVARPRSMRAWGTLPGAYVGSQHTPGFDVARGDERVPGAKPLWLMRALVRDYSRPGNLIVDPCAGGATTLLAAAMEGRRAVGAEVDPKTHALATKRLARGYTPDMFAGLACQGESTQQPLILESEKANDSAAMITDHCAKKRNDFHV